MTAHAIHPSGEGPCQGHAWERAVPFDIRALLHAMAAHGEGRPGGRHRHHRDFGGPGGRGGFGGFSFGDFGPRGGPPWRGGRKARRGDIRTAALLLLAEEPRNGYQIMQEVEQRSDGLWRPSSGSVYPALQQLEDEGLIHSVELDGRKAFELTDAGRTYVEERDPDRPAPWEQMGGDLGSRASELAKVMRDISFAFVQVMRTGNEDQQAQAGKVLVAARRDLYHILADGGEPESHDSESR